MSRRFSIIPKTAQTTLVKARFHFFCQNNEHEKRNIDLNAEFQSHYDKSLLSKIPRFIKSKELDNAFKSVYIFKDYLVPNKIRDAPFSRLIMQSYYYLVLSKVL